MTKEYTFEPQREKASAVPADPKRARQPQYGRYLEDFEPGQVFAHPRGYTFDFAGAQIFARTYMQTNPLYLNREAARAAGFRDVPASPQQVFNVALSLGVQNNSEKAMANLGYYDARFIRPVYPGDTLRALSLVLNRRERGESKPGIVHMRTLALNQKEEAVLQYERKIMIPERPAREHFTESPRFPSGLSRGLFRRLSSGIRRDPRPCHGFRHVLRGLRPRRHPPAQKRPYGERRAHGPDLSCGQHPSPALRRRLRRRAFGCDGWPPGGCTAGWSSLGWKDWPAAT